ncbi:DUF4145 domain-containing protein [Sulfuricurvum sp.]|uniref:DUF4145 domain-containing protein n=1 Tax=Sulfuricurvum sp. TaxID=2025608 RepID=UPI00260A3558|nr:DUF4145 domain-containing protein [Sulfuricurvum sp.]MDD3594860.1 DUF4145 domain-containing protein [Sulfuricurvum sp.]
MNLSSKPVFWGIWLFFVMILTGINNFYFYEFVEDMSKKNSEQLQLLINSESKCFDEKTNNKMCSEALIKTIGAFSNKALYNHSLILKDQNNSILWEKSWDKKAVAGSDINIQISDSSVNTIFTTYFDYPIFLLSVARSMTFSITDIIPIVYNQGIKEAIHEFQKQKMFKRTRPTIGFAIFSFLLLWLYRKREEQQSELQKKNEEALINDFKRQLESEKSKISEENIYNKFSKYDHILNPPINSLTFKDIITVDTDGIGNKFRKVLEKILYKILENELNIKPKDLNEAIFILYKENIISSKAQMNATLIRIYGNMDSHYNKDNEISQEEIKTIALRLISIIEEILENNLLDNSNLFNDNNEHKSKKVFDKKEKKWILVSQP